MRIDAITNDATVISKRGSRVARERLSRNLTQGELAARAGISPRVLGAFEQGRSVQLISLTAVRDHLLPGAGCDYTSSRIRYSAMRRRTDVRGVRVRAVSVGGMA